MQRRVDSSFFVITLGSDFFLKNVFAKSFVLLPSCRELVPAFFFFLCIEAGRKGGGGDIDQDRHCLRHLCQVSHSLSFQRLQNCVHEGKMRAVVTASSAMMLSMIS